MSLLAKAEGFEPPSTVLETAVLPLNYAFKLVESMGVEPMFAENSPF
jgi:hypothetical protein